MKTFINDIFFLLLNFFFSYFTNVFMCYLLLENDKILVLYISYKIELLFIHVFNLVYIVV